MALVTCPSCELPRTVADADSAPCPACGWRPGSQLTDAEPTPELAPVPSPTSPAVPVEGLDPPSYRNWVLIGGLLLVGGIAAVLLHEPRTEPPPVPESEREADVVPVAGPVLPPATPEPPEPPREVAPPPRLAGVRSSPVEPVVVPVPVPLVESVTVFRLDRPTEDYLLERLGEGNTLRLTGRVKRLRVEGIDSGATLDLTGLTLESVHIDGPIDDGATLLVKSPGATVTFQKGRVEGKSRVQLDVGTGTVLFPAPPSGKWERDRIGGGSQITIAAKTVTFGGRIVGQGTRVEVELAPSGSMKFVGIDDGARLHYRLAQPAGAPPRIAPGEVKQGAEFKRLP